MCRKVSALLVVTILVIPSIAIFSSAVAQSEYYWKGMRMSQPIEIAGKFPDRKPGELLVKFKPRTVPEQIASLHEKVNAEVLNHFKFIDVSHVRLVGRVGDEEALKIYRKNPNVVYAEFNLAYKTTAPLVPNDPRFSELWGLHNTGQTGGTVDADIDAPEAWDLSTGSSGVVVAVIDTGVDYNHQDLSANMWTNLGEIPGNGIDDDGNGYVDDVYGIDAYNGDSDPFDDHGHGTHCSGTIGAVGNNGVGVVGINWMVRIMALKFLSAGGYGYTSGAITCLNYAVWMKTYRAVNVRVTSNSWGGGGFSQSLLDAINAAAAADILFVAAAGNANNNNDVNPSYPASYDATNIISVAATDHNDQRASWSNYGPSTVHVAAPGVSILSTTPGNTYSSWSGTSMATPHVSGLAALILSRRPTFTYLKLKFNIFFTVDVKPGLQGMILTGGRINAYRALSTTGTTLQIIIARPPRGFSAMKDSPYILQAMVGTTFGPVSDTVVVCTFGLGDFMVNLKDDGVSPDSAAGDGTFVGAWLPTYPYTRGVTIQFTASAPGYSSISSSTSGTVVTIPTYAVQATTFSWMDITGTGIAFSMGDEGIVSATLPFPVSFYGGLYADITIGSNGYLNFEGAYLDWNNRPIPSELNANKVIATFWDDLIMKPYVGSGMVYIDILGAAPSRKLVISWTNVAHFNLSGGEVTFQLVLSEGSQEILMQYLDVIFPGTGYDYGASATVGIQYHPTWGTQFSYNMASLSNNFALKFIPSQKLRFDFGALTSPLEPQYTRIHPGSLYSPTIGYGWDSLTGLGAVDRGAPDALRRDFVFASVDREFKVDVPNGFYIVSMIIGDRSSSHDSIRVYSEEVLVLVGINTPAGTFQARKFTTRVADSQLNLRFNDAGGADPNWVVNVIEIHRGSLFDFGTATSPLNMGYVRVTESSLYSAVVGYGWDTTFGLASMDRGSPDALRRDFVFSSVERTFKVDLPNGRYYAIIVIGDASLLRDRIDVLMEGGLQIGELRAPTGVFKWTPAVFMVTDGQVSVTLRDNGGADVNWVVNGVILIYLGA